MKNIKYFDYKEYEEEKWITLKAQDGRCDKQGKVVMEKESENACHRGRLCPIKSESKFIPMGIQDVLDSW